MKFNNLCILFIVIVCLVSFNYSHPAPSESIDYLEALRRMKQVPQWHCLRYRRFELHSPCSRWWIMRRH
ncbi:hypothetical protein RR46_04501 [Papilio xuthus]|uniref:Uncharacterized protein n=1 Tax=Papilio xuthus TaxID=66420 RepID=A0A194PN64_PAPXU|nr:hypothetical protein RR46_04501 [Papilio xuthus]